MKQFLSGAIAILISFAAISQNYPYPALEKNEPADALHGISSKMLYRTEIRAKATQAELLNKIKSFLVEIKLLDTVKNKIDKITDKVKEFKMPLQFRSGFVAGKGKTIFAKRLRHAVILTFNAEFKFTDSLIVITFTNFRDSAFYEIKHYTEGNYPPELGFNYPVGDTKAAQLEKLKDDAMQGATLFGKLMTVYDAGGTSGTIKISGKGVSVEGDKAIKDKFAALNKTLDEQYKTINQAVNDNLGLWLNSIDALTFFNKLIPKHKKNYELAQRRVAEGYLLVLDNDRWDNYFEGVFNDALINIANLIGGEIREIKKDDTVRYSMNDGVLQPVKMPK